MTDEADIRARFWKALKHDRTFMLALAGAEEGHAQPMTAQLEDDSGRGPIWIFTSSETDLVKALGRRAAATATFADKGHDVFGSLEGMLSIEEDRATIDRLWNPYVAAWFEGGRDDPKVRLLRFDPEHGRVWLNDSSLLAGVKLLLGSDPKKDYADKVADIRPS